MPTYLTWRYPKIEDRTHSYIIAQIFLFERSNIETLEGERRTAARHYEIISKEQLATRKRGKNTLDLEGEVQDEPVVRVIEIHICEFGDTF